METNKLKKIWNTLAEEKLIDKSLAKENILEIITQKGNGVISKIQQKHKRDYYGYLSVALLAPIVILFLVYRDSQGLIDSSNSILGGPYLVPFLIEIFMIYCIMSLKRNLNFLRHTYNTGTLKESLVNVRSYFIKITRRGFWIGTISLPVILVFVEIDTFIRIGGFSGINFTSDGLYIFESYFMLSLTALIISIPFIVRKDAKKYAGVMHDLDQTIEELNEEY